ncbi:OsmC family protein [Phytohalomonas tamaricis]|uniref:OsmC family protein n=1 Tax=Phytohalomonas tamaricis TaxID=2081032 RepID=UPI000D0AFCC6|nr:OsmC family protein [Phytohalomonas tamaricis]
MASGIEHEYSVKTVWTGNKGEGTSDYRAYNRNYELQVDGKVVISGSAHPAFLGDPTLHNAEDMFVGALSTCHMLWYLHLCADAGVVVTDYVDQAVGMMAIERKGSGYFSEVTLHPRISITAESDRDKALALHEDAHRFCFVANSVNFPVRCEPEIISMPTSHHP